MSRPSNSPITIATAENYPDGSYAGLATKIPPISGIVSGGFRPETRPSPEFLNYILHNHGEWLGHLASGSTRARFADVERFVLQALDGAALPSTSGGDLVYGYGAAVGPVFLYSNAGVTSVRAFNAGPVGAEIDSSISLFTCSFDATGNRHSFAQRPDGLVVIGVEDGATAILRSVNGGMSWEEIDYPAGFATFGADLIFHDRFSGRWWIVGDDDSDNFAACYSDNDGASWTFLDLGFLNSTPGYQFSAASDPSGRLYLCPGESNSLLSVSAALDIEESNHIGGSPNPNFRSVVEFRGEVYVLGDRSSDVWIGRVDQELVGTTLAAIATFTSGTSIRTLSGVVSFSRFSTVLGHDDLVVAIGLSTAGADGIWHLMASDDLTNWRTIRMDPSLGNFDWRRWQGRNPGGVCVGTKDDGTQILRIHSTY